MIEPTPPAFDVGVLREFSCTILLHGLFKYAWVHMTFSARLAAIHCASKYIMSSCICVCVCVCVCAFEIVNTIAFDF